MGSLRNTEACRKIKKAQLTRREANTPKSIRRTLRTSLPPWSNTELPVKKKIATSRLRWLRIGSRNSRSRSLTWRCSSLCSHISRSKKKSSRHILNSIRTSISIGISSSKEPKKKISRRSWTWKTSTQKASKRTELVSRRISQWSSSSLQSSSTLDLSRNPLPNKRTIKTPIKSSSV